MECYIIPDPLIGYAESVLLCDHARFPVVPSESTVNILPTLKSSYKMFHPIKCFTK